MAYDEYLAERIRHKFKELDIPFEDKKMMGGICFLVNDKMCVGIVKEKLMARIEKIMVVLRPWNMADLDNVVRFANNKKIADNLTDAFPHPYSRSDGINYINIFQNDNPVRVFSIEIDGVACGSTGVFPQTDIHRKNAEMGYWLAEEYWGKGIMTDAVKTLFKNGQFVDELIYSILKPNQ